MQDQIRSTLRSSLASHDVLKVFLNLHCLGDAPQLQESCEGFHVMRHVLLSTARYLFSAITSMGSRID